MKCCGAMSEGNIRGCSEGFSAEGIFHSGGCLGECLQELSRVSVRIPTQDYRSLCVAVVISATVFKSKTHT